ncbi:MAG: 8-oxo-dGTP diphosphatase [Myxococcota bacterium]|nr:8-oxo-dGTP diphosphatase [Myxococcota bacterium]
MRHQDVAWNTWTPTMRATLLFIQQGERLLLIRKKTGLGKGLINAPGGKIDPGESAPQAAVREVIEELGVTPLEARWCGRLRFEFTDGLRLQCQVFHSRFYTGTPTETREAIPLWCAVDALPFDEMWADDRVWLPELLAGVPFHLEAIFDAERMLDHRLETGAGLCP